MKEILTTFSIVMMGLGVSKLLKAAVLGAYYKLRR